MKPNENIELECSADANSAGKRDYRFQVSFNILPLIQRLFCGKKKKKAARNKMGTEAKDTLFFNCAMVNTLEHEGGYVNDGQDSGGPTNFGISQRQYPDLDIKALTQDQAVKIYRRDYWDAPGIGQLTNGIVSSKVFDLGVNIGPERAIRFLQIAANQFRAGLEPDGILGPKTAGWCNEFKHQIALLMALKIVAGNYYLSLNRQRYIIGWLARLDD